MKIFSAMYIKQLDAFTMEHEPIASIDLMERAAQALAAVISKRWGTNIPLIIFAGPGNNGGDALAVARLLALKGYREDVYLFNPKGSLSPDCECNRDRLPKIPNLTFYEVTSQFQPPLLKATDVVIDGLFGVGLNKPLSGGFAAVVKHINASPATVVSIDMPSGLMGEENISNVPTPIIRANVTISMQLPKLAFFFADNEPYVGEWQLVDIGLSKEAIAEGETDYRLMEEEEIVSLLKPRGKFSHKGNYGKALLIAGSQGMAGASVLSSKACLRSGVGLLTIHVPLCNNLILQTSVPEAMTQIDDSEVCFSSVVNTDEFQAVGIGPGLGKCEETEEALLEQITACHVPMVVDADALNLLEAHHSHLKQLPPGSILTPHPKELERLVGKCRNSYERLMRARELAQTSQVYILLKGAYSVVIAPSGKCWFNPTGNPGMAKGGSGDVLTGILLALLAQGYDTESAARIGVYVHGLAGDIACKKLGSIGMTAADIVSCLPPAWQILEERANAFPPFRQVK